MDNPFRHLSKGEKVAVGIGGLVVVYFVYKQHQASSAAASSASAIDPLTGLPVSQDSQTDPQTGMTYLAEAQQYGSVAAADAAVSSGSAYGYGSSYGAGYGSYGPVGSSATPLVSANTVQSATYASNAAWAQAVESGLSDVGYSSTDIAAALGRYLGNLPETSTQATIVNAAVAEYGPPPVGSYSVILAPSTGSTGSGNSGSGTSSGTGAGTGDSSSSGSGASSGGGWSSGGGSSSGGSSSGGSSQQESTVSGGHIVSANRNDVTVAWVPSGPATRWLVTLHFPGSENGRQATVSSPQASYSGLPSGHTGTVQVQPLPSGRPGHIEIRTT